MTGRLPPSPWGVCWQHRGPGGLLGDFSPPRTAVSTGHRAATVLLELGPRVIVTRASSCETKTMKSTGWGGRGEGSRPLIPTPLRAREPQGSPGGCAPLTQQEDRKSAEVPPGNVGERAPVLHLGEVEDDGDAGDEEEVKHTQDGQE